MSDLIQEISGNLTEGLAKIKDKAIRNAFNLSLGRDFHFSDVNSHKIELFVYKGQSEFGVNFDREVYVMDGKPLVEIHEKPITATGNAYHASIGVKYLD